jgi:hypothetical protein
VLGRFVLSAARKAALVVADEPKGDMHDRFVYAASEPLSGWVAIALAFSLGVLRGVGLDSYQPCGGAM